MCVSVGVSVSVSVIVSVSFFTNFLYVTGSGKMNLKGICRKWE